MSELLKRETQDRLGRHSFPLVSERSVYRTRIVEDLALPRVLTELAKRSFIARSIEEWNCLDDDTKACNTKQSVQNRLNPKRKPPAYYGFELDRVTAINFTRLRVNNANLSLNLYRRNLADSPACGCGCLLESTSHYFLHCPRYQRARDDAKAAIPDASMWNLQDILHGSTIRYEPEENEVLCRVVQEFIRTTDRF